MSNIRAGTEQRSMLLTRLAPRPRGTAASVSGSVAAATIAFGDHGGVAGLHPLRQDGLEGVPSLLVDRHWVLAPHHARVEAGARVEQLDEQNADAVLAHLVVDGLGVALDHVLSIIAMNSLTTDRPADDMLGGGPLPLLLSLYMSASSLVMPDMADVAVEPMLVFQQLRLLLAGNGPTPALLTRTSMRPNRSITSPTAVATDSSLVTSRSSNVAHRGPAWLARRCGWCR